MKTYRLKDEKIVKHLGRIFQEQLRRETTQTHGDENNIPSYNDTSYTSSYISDNEVIYSDNYDDFREFQSKKFHKKYRLYFNIFFLIICLRFYTQSVNGRKYQ